MLRFFRRSAVKSWLLGLIFLTGCTNTFPRLADADGSMHGALTREEQQQIIREMTDEVNTQRNAVRNEFNRLN